MSKTQEISAPKLWMVLARCHRALSLLVEDSIASAGLCPTDFAVLEALLHKGPLTISEIQEKVLLASGSMTAAVDRAEAKGLIVRKTTPADRRARLLTLTPQGKRAAQAVFKKHARDLEEAMSVLDESEKRQLYGALKKQGLFAAQRLAQQKKKGKKQDD